MKYKLLSQTLTLAAMLSFGPAALAQGFGHQQMTAANLNAQRAHLEAQINTLAGSGRMHPGQANSLRAQLDSNARLQARYLSDGFSFAEAQQLLTALNNIQTSLNSYGYGGGWSGYRGGYGGGFGGGFANINQMQAQALSRINQGRARGLLTNAEYRRLMNEYNAIANRERQLRRGGLNPAERNWLVNRLQTLNSRLINEMRDSQTAGRGRFWF